MSFKAARATSALSVAPAFAPTAAFALAEAIALAAAVALLAGCAGTPPKLREGLWDVHGQIVEGPGDKRSDFSYKLCRDHTVDRTADDTLKEVKGCNTVMKNLGGGKFSSASRCTVAGTTIDSTGLSVFTSNAATHFETHAVYSPALRGKTEETMTQDQTFVGKCPTDMKPGDTQTADGFILHHDG